MQLTRHTPEDHAWIQAVRPDAVRINEVDYRESLVLQVDDRPRSWPVRAVAVGPTGRLFTGDDEGTVRIWEVGSGTAIGPDPRLRPRHSPPGDRPDAALSGRCAAPGLAGTRYRRRNHDPRQCRAHLQHSCQRGPARDGRADLGGGLTLAPRLTGPLSAAAGIRPGPPADRRAGFRNAAPCRRAHCGPSARSSGRPRPTPPRRPGVRGCVHRPTACARSA